MAEKPSIDVIIEQIQNYENTTIDTISAERIIERLKDIKIRTGEIANIAEKINTEYEAMKNILDTYNITVTTRTNEVIDYANSAKKDAQEASISLAELKNTVVNIVNTAEGKAITVSDCSNKPFEINIYGESKQNDVPTMDTPQAIINIDTNIDLLLANKNLLKTPYTEYNKLTATANKDDYNVYIPKYPFYIVEGTKYTFSYESDGTAGGTAGTDTVQAGLLDTTNNIHYMTTNNKYITFTAKKTGKCSFRYDVNKNGCTHSFWNFMCEISDLKTNYVDSENQSLEVTLTEPLRAVPCSNNEYANVIINDVGFITDEICVKDGMLGVLKRIDNTRLTSSGFVEYTNSATDKKIYQKGLGTTYMYAAAKNALCTHFRVENKNYTIGDIFFPDKRVMVTVSNNYDLDKFKQFLDDNYVYIQLPLAKPIFTIFDDDIQAKFKDLATYYGITNVCNNKGAYNKLNYIADTKLYIDNKFNEVAKAVVATESEV